MSLIVSVGTVPCHGLVQTLWCCVTFIGLANIWNSIQQSKRLTHFFGKAWAYNVAGQFAELCTDAHHAADNLFAFKIKFYGFWQLFYPWNDNFIDVSESIYMNHQTITTMLTILSVIIFLSIGYYFYKNDIDIKWCGGNFMRIPKYRYVDVNISDHLSCFMLVSWSR